MKRALLSSVAALAMCLLGGLAIFTGVATATSSAPSTTGLTIDVNLKLQRDGRLSVTETVTVPPGSAVHRTVSLRQPTSDGAYRIFTVSDVSVQGDGSAKMTESALNVTLRPGKSTVTYTVGGTVAALEDGQRMRWQVASGWDTEVSKITVSFIVPDMVQSIDCTVGSSGKCTQFNTQQHRAIQNGLQPGQSMVLSIVLPKGTVPANARFDETSSWASAFALTPVSGAGLAAIGLLLVGGFGLLWYVRGRDERALASDVGPVEVLLNDRDGSVTFASPDGVLPGQVGTVIDEHVDVVDVTATVVDLAVRNYLWIEELPAEMQAKDWRVVRMNPPDDSLRPYERAVYELLLGGDHEANAREQVLLSELRSGEALDLIGVRDRLYSDVVDKNWFDRRPDSERNLFWWGGIGLTLTGVVLTVVLAFTTTLALLGLGVVFGGIAATAGARLMPARARRGSALVAQMRGLRDYLRGVAASEIPEADREMVFSRSLPYAVVLGETERWLSEFAELDPGADGTPGLYWYGELVEQAGHVVPNLRRFRTHFPMLVSAMDGVLAQAGHLRSLKQ